MLKFSFQGNLYTRKTLAPGSKLPGAAHKACVYLDYNATTPIFPEVAAAMEPFLWSGLADSVQYVLATS